MVHHTITSSFHFEHSLAPNQALPVTPELPIPAVLPGGHSEHFHLTAGETTSYIFLPL